MQNEISTNSSMYLSVKETTKQLPAFSEGSLRFLLFNRKNNGLDRCVRRIGRKLLICLPEFTKWLDEQREVK